MEGKEGSSRVLAIDMLSCHHICNQQLNTRRGRNRSPIFVSKATHARTFGLLDDTKSAMSISLGVLHSGAPHYSLISATILHAALRGGFCRIRARTRCQRRKCSTWFAGGIVALLWEMRHSCVVVVRGRRRRRLAKVHRRLRWRG